MGEVGTELAYEKLLPIISAGKREVSDNENLYQDTD
jgi:hypothetical protein